MNRGERRERREHRTDVIPAVILREAKDAGMALSLSAFSVFSAVQFNRATERQSGRTPSEFVQATYLLRTLVTAGTLARHAACTTDDVVVIRA
jgi:hypothetical protein